MAEMRSSIVLTVFSTASGIGKTLAAINIAAELARLNHSVCLLDLDLQFGDVCNYLKLTPTRTISDAQSALDNNQFRAEEFLTPYSHGRTTFYVMAPPKTLLESYNIQSATVERLVAELNHFDFIVFDTPKIFSDLNLTVLDVSTIITFLCVADFVPAIKNLKTGYDTLHKFNYEDNKFRLVQNRSDSQKLILTKDVEQVLGKQFYHNLPNDYASARRSIERGCPLVLDDNSTALTESLRELVARYTNRNTGAVEAEAQSKGIFSWLKGLFGGR